MVEEHTSNNIWAEQTGVERVSEAGGGGSKLSGKGRGNGAVESCGK